MGKSVLRLLRLHQEAVGCVCRYTVARSNCRLICSSDPDLELDLYTTMEACSERLSGAQPCAQRIIAFNRTRPRLRINDFGSRRLRIVRVFQGVSEPKDFVADCQGARLLRDAGIEVQTVRAADPRRTADGGEDWDWLERECLRLAKYGHPDQPRPLPGAEALWK